ncbi:MAG: phosphate ABC transporter permease PstA [Cyanobacteria bacterium]|nr:phosphate ABC transporter permease PstA [Cyanobacteriota bacterium]MDW8202980.1 phosphate ABC transporter permease PstA [Cyanobacteriota bacterium SKYGB_h_bin112]
MTGGKLAHDVQSDLSRRKLIDAIFVIVGMVALLVATIVLLTLITSLAVRGVPRATLNFPEFFFTFASRRPTAAGIYAAWVGSALVMVVTACTAVPLGVAAGIYLEEYARKNWVSDLIEINVTNLAGVPSIIYGLLALGVLNQGLKLGESILTAGITLALLILPVVIVTTREALRAIPLSLREAAYAVGATKWRMIWDHILPYATGSILTGVIIGLSRAIGETAPLITIGALTFIAFLPVNTESLPAFISSFLSFAWLKEPFTVMPIQMFNWVSRPEPAFQDNAAAAGIVLLLMTLAMNGVAIYLRYRFRKGIKW